jgi:hypothetical protein
MPIVRLACKEWKPDLPSVGSGYSVNVRNVIPRTPETFGPFPDFQSYASSPLAARCQGAVSVLDSAGNVHTFAGTATKLYQMTVAGPTFSDVSGAAYSCATDEHWSYTLFGDNVIAANIGDSIQSFVLGTSSAFANLSSAAPKARYVATVKGWLMAANTTDPIDGVVPWRTWWSAYNDPTSWPTPGTAAAAEAQSDFNDTVGDGGWIQGIVGNLGTADAALFFEHAVWRVVYSGPPAIFTFSPAEGVRGTPAPDSIVQMGALVYYLGEDGFYVFDGTSSLPIGANKVDRFFFADVDQSYLFRIVGAVDPVNKLIVWAYPGSGHTQGNPNRLLVYNWFTQSWSIGYLETETIFRTLTFGYSLDGLDMLSSSLDALSFSLDSRAYTGGNLVLGGFNLSHTMGYFSGSALAPIVDTEEVQPFLGQRTFVRNARPIVDGAVTPSVAIGTRTTSEATATFGAASAMNSLGWCPLRSNGQYTRARLTVPAASVFNHIQGVELDCDPAGAR